MKNYRWAITLSLLSLSACAPKITVLDRPTLMQAESVGSFPDLEKSFDKSSLQIGPQMLGRGQLQKKQSPEKAFNILDGELLRESPKR